MLPHHKPVAEMIVLQSYANAAARTDASLIKFPPVTLTTQALPANNTAQQTGASSAPEPDPGSTKKRKTSGSDRVSEISEASQAKQPKVKESATAAAAAAAVSSTALLDDDIDWNATADESDLQLASSAVDAVQEDSRSQPSAGEPDAAPAQSQHADTADEHEPLEQQQAAFAAQQVPCSAGDKADRQVQHAVAEYVKALLDPFYKAGIVDREVSCHVKPSPFVLYSCKTACAFSVCAASTLRASFSPFVCLQTLGLPARL